MALLIMYFRIAYKHIFVAAAIGLLLFLILAPSSQAAELTPLEKTQIAALYSQLDNLKRMLEILVSYLFKGGFAQVSSTCSSSLIALLGSGCHYMYNDSAGNQIFCDGPMIKSAKVGDSTTTSGCSSGGYTSGSGGSTTSSSCTSSLIALLGDGCHYMYNDSVGNQIFCDGPMTKSAKTGDTTTTSGCSSGGYTSGGSTTTTPPPTPGGFTVTLSGNGTSITLSWNDVSGETQYKIWRQQNSTWSFLTSVGANVVSYIDTTSPGTYDYHLKACNGEICSTADATLSSPVTLSAADTISPSIPTGLTASAPTANRVDLAWVASTDNVGVTGYRIFRNNVSLTTIGAAINYTDSTVVAATTYGYSVAAMDAAGNESPPSSSVTVTTPSGGGTTTTTIPSPPTGLSATIATAGSVNLTWVDVTGETEYKIYRRISPYGTWNTVLPPTSSLGANVTVFTDSSSIAGTYDYRVNACNSAGCSNDSNIVTATVSSGGTTTTTCSQYGSGWHTMDSSGNCFDSAMQNYRTANGTLYSCVTTPTYGCSTGGSTTTTTSCSSFLTSLLGSGCHYMYNDSSARPIYCDGPMTKSAKEGDTTTTVGCTGGSNTTTPPTGQKEQIWNSFGLRSWVRSDADLARIEQLKQSCNNVSSGSNVWLPGSGNSTSVDFGMPSADKCRIAAACTSSQYFDGASCVSSGTYTGGGTQICDSALTSLLGSGCHYMYNDSVGNQIFCDGPMTKSAKRGDAATTTGCVSSTSGSTYAGDANSCPGFAYSRWDSAGRRYCQLNSSVSCSYNYPAYLTQSNYGPSSCPAETSISTYATSTATTGCSQYGSGWHTMDSSGNCFDPNMNNYRTANGTLYSCSITPTSGCSSYTGEITGGTTCDTALNTLLGNGCHQMYTDSSGNPIFCDGNMTRSAKRGDTATTAGCQLGGGAVTASFGIDPYNTYPRDGERQASTLSHIRVKFTREIDSASTAAQFFSLVMSSDQTSSINGSFQFLGDTFEFTPATPLQPGTNYTYKIFTTLKERGGTYLPVPFGATFTTVGSGAEVTVSTIEGSVKDPDGQPVRGAFIQASKEDFSAKFSMNSGSDGNFKIVVQPGTYVVEVYSPYDKQEFLRPAPSRVTVGSGSVQTVSFQFTGSSKAVSGSVKFSGGDPVTDAEVGAYSLSSYQWRSTLVDSKGAYTLRLGSGKWKLGIRPKDSASVKWFYDGSYPEVSFSKDNNSEFQLIDFTVPLYDATLSVLAVDDQDKVLADAGVVVDTLRSGQHSEEGVVSSPQFKITDSTGSAKFTLRSNRYYVKGYINSDRGYLNPLEQEVTTVGNRTIDVKLVFKKRTQATSFSIKGIVKLEEGIPTDAFVWGWSEKGGYVSTLSAADGSFEFKVGPNDRWHIGAGKAINKIPYKSSEIVVDVQEAPVSIEILLAKFEKEILAPSVTVKEVATKQIVVQAEDGARAVIPPQAAGTSGNISVEVRPTVEAPSQVSSQLVSTVYDVSIRDSAGKSVTSLNSDIEIIIPYDEAELKANGVSEDEIVPSFFDEKTGTWVKIDNFTIDKEKNVVICRVKHLTRFSLVAPADTTPPSAPTGVIVTALGDGKIKISWQNPVKDFAYARVYRNDGAGELGKIVASQLKGQQYTDERVSDGITYYYTVRAIDPAGNESNNKDQKSVKAVGVAAKVKVTEKSMPKGQAPKEGFLRNFAQGARGEDVKTLQALLLKEGVYPGGSVTGFYGKLTKEAVIRFQEKYAKEILMPAGLSRGNGFIGAGTRKKLNELLMK